MASIVHTLAASPSGDPVVVDLGTHSYTAGNKLIFFIGMHGDSPAISTIALHTAGAVPTGTSMTKMDDVLITSEAYWEVWKCDIPSTSTTYELAIDATGSIAGGAGAFLIETDATTLEIGPSNTGSFGGTVTAMPVVTTDREAIILIGAHSDGAYLSTSTIDDSFTVGNSSSSRQFIAYRVASGGVTTAASVTWGVPTPSSETGEAVTIALYTVAETKRGTFVFGENGTVTSSPTLLANMDAVTRTVDIPNAMVLGGTLVIFESAAEPTGIANAARLFAIDDGAGKTVLKAIFGSGAAQVLATEP